ncbi:uncharacterized protein amer3 [Scleropages formosus]|uniref:APC membrane recruitment protein 3 n=1 Tax=Scleropages formosus TaxID=113540 RepID=A0A8C9R807_SCLFO|nr:APC membrane recruitment protein 3 [Scleropages formosus]XP_018608690.2 APC membrane recruitment protein 3 [Scleropages formosus]
MDLPTSSSRSSVQVPGDASKYDSGTCSPTSYSDSGGPRGDPRVQTPVSTPSPVLTVSPSMGWLRHGAVRKSKTHDCVVGMGTRAGHRGSGTRLVSSTSFSELHSSQDGLLRENHSTSGGSREIIDYRNLTPQLPFVPSIAKSVPKKKISVRKPRKAIKELLGKRTHKQEKAASPQAVVLARGGHLLLPQELPLLSPSAALENSDALSDSSFELCTSICEDVASLKSFGSHTGCGEIFADEEHPNSMLIPMEPIQRKDSEKDSTESRKASPVVGCFQGGVEQMASPAHSEILDLLGLWGSLNRTVLLKPSTRTEAKMEKNTKVSTPTPAEPPGQQCIASPEKTLKPVEHKTADPEEATPKSDKQEIISTSDEGYYDYISPALEESGKGSLTPCLSNRFPRDSYSGDALYELFYDPNECGMSPIIDEDVKLSESLRGLASDLPLSMYSFHDGAEENLAPPLALDFISQELLQSSWKGKECLLKLCDTEISLAMGIVNWLKQKTQSTDSAGSVCGNEHGEKRCTPHLGELLSTEDLDMADRQPTMEHSDPENFASKNRVVSLHDDIIATNVQSKSIKEETILPSPECVSHMESQIKTPTNGFWFRIFNKDSPLTPNRELKSPLLRSPGSTTSTVFLLAINRESLCESCKKLLKQGSKELYLCTSCVSFIEYIKTSDILSPSDFPRIGSVGTPRSLPRGFLESPVSPCRMESDASLMHLLEQCISQMSSVSLNGSNSVGGQDKDSPITPLAESLWDNLKRNVNLEKGKEQHHKYLKSKHKVKSSKTTKRESSHGTNRQDEGTASLPPRESENLGTSDDLDLVTASSLDELIPEMYDSSCSDLPRPTYLPLSNLAYSEFASKLSEMDSWGRAKGQPRKRTRRHKKTAVNRDGPCGYVMPDEKKVECKRRMKK